MQLVAQLVQVGIRIGELAEVWSQSEGDAQERARAIESSGDGVGAGQVVKADPAIGVGQGDLRQLSLVLVKERRDPRLVHPDLGVHQPREVR